jgi:hypothetical protein
MCVRMNVYGYMYKHPHDHAQDWDYKVRNSEKLHSRYVVTPPHGRRSSLVGMGSFGTVISGRNVCVYVCVCVWM